MAGINRIPLFTECTHMTQLMTGNVQVRKVRAQNAK